MMKFIGMVEIEYFGCRFVDGYIDFVLDVVFNGSICLATEIGGEVNL